jgi:hypothetical protein
MGEGRFVSVSAAEKAALAQELNYNVDRAISAYASLLFAAMDVFVGAWMIIPTFRMEPPVMPPYFAGERNELLFGSVLLLIGCARALAYYRRMDRLRRMADMLACIFWSLCAVHFAAIGWLGISLPMTAALAVKNAAVFVLNSRRLIIGRPN